jgi:hypothetical protein
MSQNTENLEKKGVARELFLGLIFVHPIFFDQWTLIDINNITNLVDPVDCTDFWPGTTVSGATV